MDTEHGIYLLHRKIRAEGQPGATIEQALPGVGAGQALLAQALIRPVHVTGRVRWLHCSDHTQPGETRNIIRVKNLGMLHAVPSRVIRKLYQCFFIGVENLAISRIPNRVNSRLESAGKDPAQSSFHFIRADKHQPAIAWIVAVVSQ